MSNLTFRGRKDGETFDAGFYVHDSDRDLSNLSSWFIGDVVGVCFSSQRELIRQIREHCPGDFQFHASDEFLQVRCIVVKRHHSVVWKSVGRFDRLGTCGVVLEAESGYWEDVLRWVVLNQKPTWIPD